MSKEKERRSIWDSLGKIFRGRKEEIPLGCDYCSNCGKIFPIEEIHIIISFFGNRRQELHICEDCIELPPSTWSNKYSYKRGHSDA